MSAEVFVPAGASIGEQVRSLAIRLGGGDWFHRLDFTVYESHLVPPGEMLVDRLAGRIIVGDLPAFREAMDWAELDADVRRIFNDALRRLARRWGVPTNGIPVRR